MYLQLQLTRHVSVLVVALYSKTGGSNGKHAFVATIDSLSQASYIAVQLYERFGGYHFSHIPEAISLLQTRQYALLPPAAFLCVISAPTSSQGDKIALLDQDCGLFGDLNSLPGKQKVLIAMQELGVIRKEPARRGGRRAKGATGVK